LHEEFEDFRQHFPGDTAPFVFDPQDDIAAFERCGDADGFSRLRLADIVGYVFDDDLLHVAVPDTDALYAFVIDRLTERSEVADVNTSVVYEHIRRTVLEPLRVIHSG
jgi:hypothetical protein